MPYQNGIGDLVMMLMMCHMQCLCLCWYSRWLGACWAVFCCAGRPAILYRLSCAAAPYAVSGYGYTTRLYSGILDGRHAYGTLVNFALSLSLVTHMRHCRSHN